MNNLIWQNRFFVISSGEQFWSFIAFPRVHRMVIYIFFTSALYGYFTHFYQSTGWLLFSSFYQCTVQCTVLGGEVTLALYSFFISSLMGRHFYQCIGGLFYTFPPVHWMVMCIYCFYQCTRLLYQVVTLAEYRFFVSSLITLYISTSVHQCSYL